MNSPWVYTAKKGPKQLLPLPEYVLTEFLNHQYKCPGCGSAGKGMIVQANDIRAFVYIKYYLKKEANFHAAFKKEGYEYSSVRTRHCMNCGTLLALTRWTTPKKGVRRRVVLDSFGIEELLERHQIQCSPINVD